MKLDRDNITLIYLCPKKSNYFDPVKSENLFETGFEDRYTIFLISHFIIRIISSYLQANLA